MGIGMEMIVRPDTRQVFVQIYIVAIAKHVRH